MPVENAGVQQQNRKARKPKIPRTPGEGTPMAGMQTGTTSREETREWK
jgi:hypothetical protein